MLKRFNRPASLNMLHLFSAQLGPVFQSRSHNRVITLARGIVLSLLIFPSIVLQVGCGSKKPPAPPPPQYLSHVIQYPGETLSIIAAWYTGASRNWHEIAAVNPELRPNRLKKGMIILVPRELLVKESPLPKRFVDTLNARSAPIKEKVESIEASNIERGGVPAPVMEGDSLTEADTSPPSALPMLPDPIAPSPNQLQGNNAGALMPNAPAETNAATVADSQLRKSEADLEAERQKTRDRLLQELLSEQ